MTSAPEHWKRVPIKQVYEGLFDGPHATPPPSGEGPVFLGIKNITDDGHLDLTTVRHIAEEDFDRWTKRVTPREGDIVFTYEATLNRYAIIPHGFRGCLGRRLALIRPDIKKVDTRFLHYLFFSPDWRFTIEKNKLSGATVDRVPLTNFPEFPIWYPPLDEQSQIASILSAYDDLIAKNTRRIEILEEMARRVYEEWFAHFRYPGHEADEFVNSDSGRRPATWIELTIKDCVELCYGKALKQSDRALGDVPVYGSSGVVGYHDSALVNGPGVIVGRKGNVGSVHWCDTDFYPIDTTYYVKTTVPLEFIYFNFQKQNFINNDAAVPGLNRNQAYSLPLLRPPENLLSDFVRFCAPTFGLAQNLRRGIVNLRKQRDLLLPKLVSGQIEVSEVRAELKDAVA